MNWYMTKIVYRIVCGEGQHKPQFDEQLRLIQASSEREAFNKARVVGTQDECSFLNDRQQMVRWQFINVSELYKLPALYDGAELYSRVKEADHAGLFIERVHHMAEQIVSSSASDPADRPYEEHRADTVQLPLQLI